MLAQEKGVNPKTLLKPESRNGFSKPVPIAISSPLHVKHSGTQNFAAYKETKRNSSQVPHTINTGKIEAPTPEPITPDRHRLYNNSMTEKKSTTPLKTVKEKNPYNVTDGFKTFMQTRDVDLVKPRDQKTDMWHMLALQQSMQDKKFDQAM